MNSFLVEVEYSIFFNFLSQFMTFLWIFLCILVSFFDLMLRFMISWVLYFYFSYCFVLLLINFIFFDYVYYLWPSILKLFMNILKQQGNQHLSFKFVKHKTFPPSRVFSIIYERRHLVARLQTTISANRFFQ